MTVYVVRLHIYSLRARCELDVPSGARLDSQRIVYAINMFIIPGLSFDIV